MVSFAQVFLFRFSKETGWTNNCLGEKRHERNLGSKKGFLKSIGAAKGYSGCYTPGLYSRYSHPGKRVPRHKSPGITYPLLAIYATNRVL